MSVVGFSNVELGNVSRARFFCHCVATLGHVMALADLERCSDFPDALRERHSEKDLARLCGRLNTSRTVQSAKLICLGAGARRTIRSGSSASSVILYDVAFSPEGVIDDVETARLRTKLAAE
jgi:hypothetical protein